ncbi:MAG: HD domain-containing protein [Chloroflexi bacterium]|nr:MAG: HD domain-containing protein [Chloroflexota bacterium]
MSQLDDALRIAVAAHAGQVDKAGQPYILHPLRLMMRMTSEAARIVAVLHDVVEDTDVSLDDLRAAGFGDEVIEAVELVTRRDTETYDEFIARIAPHALARQVKLADLEDNMDTRRLQTIDERTVERMQRYLRSWQLLRSIEDANT